MPRRLFRIAAVAAVALAPPLRVAAQTALADAGATPGPGEAPAVPATPPSSQPGPAPEQPGIATQDWAIHGQTTFTEQMHPGFTAPFTGPQSLAPAAEGRETWDATVYAGFRPWSGAEIWINPEADQGFGLSDTFGVAGYLSGEAYKEGWPTPYYRMARAFFRQTIELGGEMRKVDPGLNQLGGSQATNRVLLTIGKMAVTDVFDTNQYANNPRSDFFNWSIINASAFDYAADAWGSTYGTTMEWYQNWWTIRLGLFDDSIDPNDKKLDNRFFDQTQFVAEVEERHTLWDQPGAVKVLYWLTRARLGTYEDAIALAATTGQTPGTSLVRNYRSKYGLELNIQQQLRSWLGFFARLSMAQGSVAEDDFTDIDQSVSAGVSLSGTRWGRPDDTVGLAAAANQISHVAKEYFALGGRGGIIGDGMLPEAGPEQIIETYYNLAVFGFAHVTTDYQFVNNPAYNRQRGPVSVFGLRLHAEF